MPVNPLTGRKIKKSGTTYQKLVAQGVLPTHHKKRTVHRQCKSLKRPTCLLDTNCNWAKRVGCRTKKSGVIATGPFALL